MRIAAAALATLLIRTAGTHPHPHFTDVVKGLRTTCRADVRFTFNPSSVQ